MQPRQMEILRRGLDKTFLQAGEPITWYKFITAAVGTPALGIGGSETFSTAQAMAIGHSRMWDVLEAQRPGGRAESGFLVILLREPVDGRDRVGYRGTVWDIGSDPEPANIGGILYYRVILQRAGT